MASIFQVARLLARKTQATKARTRATAASRLLATRRRRDQAMTREVTRVTTCRAQIMLPHLSMATPARMHRTGAMETTHRLLAIPPLSRAWSRL
jgi:hypothetical protein